MNADRLPPSASQVTSPTQLVTFTFEGKRVEGVEGDTVASALYASGVRTFTRSFKYHRPRGLLCVSGSCPNCLMNVDGVPSVRTCTEPLREGMAVRHQNAWPSLKHDLMSVLDRLDKLLPVGFYYKTFIRPRFLWRMVSPWMRRVAGLGKIDVDDPPGSHYEHLHQHTDVAVVGGGPAGMSAAAEAGRAGLRVTLIDDQPSFGGHLRADSHVYRDPPESGASGRPGHDIAEGLAQTLSELPNVHVINHASAFGLYEGNLLGILQDKRVIKLRADSIVVATGAKQIPYVFRNNDLPGVMLGAGVQRLMNLYGVRPGRRAVVVTDDETGYDLAKEMLDAGVQVSALVDRRAVSNTDPHGTMELDQAGVATYLAHHVVRAHGTRHVRGLTIAHNTTGPGINGPGTNRKKTRISCDLVCISGPYQPESALLQQAGCRMAYDAVLGETIPTDLPQDVYAVGDVTGIHDLWPVILQGRIAGQEAAGRVAGQLPRMRGDLARQTQSYRQVATDSGIRGEMPPIDPKERKKSFACFCEDVTAKDVSDAVSEGYGDIELLKRYSTFAMGPCQGRMCQANVRTLCARETGRPMEEIFPTTSRPPARPVPLGALAGPAHMPMRLTPMHYLHLELGAEMGDVGQWRRPHHYTTIEEECRAVRERVGIIDVSTLGKLDVQGKDAAKLLDRVYTNTHSNLAVGRTRYGVVCSDSGVIMDDGTVSRIGPDHFYLTTGTGNTDLMEEWFKWWAAGPNSCVHVTNVSAAYAAVNVAGPNARDLLRKLTDADLAPDSFTYMTHREATVAGVRVRMIRVGFVGETGWELHCPAEFGEHLWTTIMEAGQEFGIAPFGVEAQRVLRLEKKHIIPAQDTDAVSNPLEADMAWVARMQKDDFIGKQGLRAVQERGLRDSLVGFVMSDSVVPRDGDPVVADGQPVGRVTSSRYSHVLGKGIGLAWVPVSMSEEDTEIGVLVNGKPVAGRVVTQPFYDPDGGRLRE